VKKMYCKISVIIYWQKNYIVHIQYIIDTFVLLSLLFSTTIQTCSCFEFILTFQFTHGTQNARWYSYHTS